MQAPIITKPFIVVPAWREVLHGASAQDYPLTLNIDGRLGDKLTPRLFVAEDVYWHAWRIKNRFDMPRQLADTMFAHVPDDATRMELMGCATSDAGKHAMLAEASAIVCGLARGEIAVFVGFQTAVSAFVEPHLRGDKNIVTTPNAAYLVKPFAARAQEAVSQITMPDGRPVPSKALDAHIRRMSLV